MDTIGTAATGISGRYCRTSSCLSCASCSRGAGWQPALRSCFLGLPALLCLTACLVVPSDAAERAFEPAFDPELVDWSLTRQFVDGKAAEPDGSKVKKVLGFYDGPNWDREKWEQRPESDAGEHTYQYLVVLKKPVAVGALCANAGDPPGEYKGSRNGGEVFYLKADAPLPSDLRAGSEAWVKVGFGGAQPFLRFATLPPNTKSQAFLYTDVRAAGPACLTYWQFYRPRLVSMTPAATGYAEGPQDAGGLVLGGSWQTQRKGAPVSAKSPAWYVLAWEQEQALAGVFLYSNASQFRLLSFTGGVGEDPALAPPGSWTPVEFTAEADHKHAFQHWDYRFRWLGFPALKTRALRLQFLGAERGGQDVWVSGLGAFVDLREAPAPVLAARDDRPPFRVPCTLPQAGEVALAVNSTDGKRVRSLFAQIARNRGATEEAWDLKDDAGAYVPPGKYQFSGISSAALELRYEMTPYPNVQQLFPDRVPWITSHSGVHGWLSDHCQNWACATRGDRVYFGAPMAEAGVCLIECDLDGKKLWGKHDFDPWTGVNMMAADENAVYVDRGGPVYRLDPAGHKVTKIFQYGTNPERRGYMSALAAWGGKVALAFTGEPLLDNATVADQVDLANCLPKPPDDEFLRLLRLTGTPPGRDVRPGERKPQGNGRLDLESTFGPEPEQYAVVAFKRPVPLGSVVFPCPAGPEQVQLSVSKADAPYPPRAKTESDWLPFESQPKPGWNCLPAPPNTVTRALRVKFARPADAKGEWLGRLEGLKLLRRRFAGLFASARVRVNSGEVGVGGVWDAKRTEAVWHDKPGICLLEWDQPQKVSGLALKEVDGAVTEVDVWQGPAAGAIPMEGAALDRKSKAAGWRNVATYKQARRSAQYSNENNRFARYLDGYVDFQEEVETRAIRLRVTEQWLDNDTGKDNAACRRHDGRSEHGLHFTQSYAAALDTRLCGILGVAPLQYVRGEPPLDAMMYERVEIYDGTNGKLVKELPARLGWHGLAFGPKGELYGIAKDHVNIVKVDTETGLCTPVITDSQPHTMAVGPDGLIYVHPWTDDCRVPIRVYDAQGKFLRTIGKGGGWKPGPWDPERLGPVHRMCADRNGSLWLVETDNYPRRIVQFKTDGTWVKEILGNTFYGSGGGGTLNRYDKRRAYYGRVEFELDWEKHTSRIRGLLAENLESGDIVAARPKGRKETYLVTTPLSMDPRQSHGAVYLYNEETGTVRLVAALGDATSFRLLRNSAVISLLKGGVLRDYSFLWSDCNANGQVDADEVQFEKKKARQSPAVGRFDEELGCVGEGARYEVREFLADGTPVYERKPAPGAPHFRLSDGRLFTLYGTPPGGLPVSEDFVTTPAGEKVWGYPAGGGVSGLNIPPWKPGQVTNEFGIIGHETAPAGDLGEFLVVHANTGQWKIWTADGLLAGQILLHKTDPRARFLGPTVAPPGTRLDPLSANQEHFHGFFTRSEADGKYYVIFGFTNMSIVEVVGLDRFQRFRAEVTVAPEDLQKARAWEAERARRTVASRALVLTARRLARPPVMDGKAGPKEWPAEAASLGEGLNATLTAGYDNQSLYLCWTCKEAGPLKNSGAEYQRLFKSGAGLDFLLATDPGVDPKRQQPAKGDLRLLLTFVEGKPKAVLYQPVAPGAKPEERWETFTAAGGKTAFDRVALLPEVTLAMTGDRDFTVEAAVPLAALGFQVRPGLRLKMDWGVLTTSDGRQVKQRQYWAKSTATGTSDEAVEARLEPYLWGHIRFEE